MSTSAAIPAAAFTTPPAVFRSITPICFSRPIVFHQPALRRVPDAPAPLVVRVEWPAEPPPWLQAILDTTAVKAELLDIPELALTLTASEKTVRRMVDSGDLPKPVRLGRLIRWRRDEITKWISDGCPSQSTAPSRRAPGARR